MKTIFSAKISTLNEFGHKRIDQEGVYLTFEKAFEFLKSSFYESPQARQLKLYRFDITEIEIDSDNIIKVWEYNCKGDLVNETEQSDSENLKNALDFEKGEIIKLKLTDYWESSNIDAPILAVISETPKQDNEEFEFMIDYISNLGFLDHKHVETKQLEKFNGSIPEEYEFLKILSDYYKGKVDISNEVLIEMRNCNVYLKNIKSYKELTIKNN